MSLNIAATAQILAVDTMTIKQRAESLPQQVISGAFETPEDFPDGALVDDDGAFLIDDDGAYLVDN